MPLSAYIKQLRAKIGHELLLARLRRILDIFATEYTESDRVHRGKASFLNPQIESANGIILESANRHSSRKSSL